jgi:hypothetical protein
LKAGLKCQLASNVGNDKKGGANQFQIGSFKDGIRANPGLRSAPDPTSSFESQVRRFAAGGRRLKAGDPVFNALAPDRTLTASERVTALW